MKTKNPGIHRSIIGPPVVLVALGIGVSPARVEIQTTDTPGSPSATTTIEGKQLPAPEPSFGGVIKQKASESKPWWPPRVIPAKGAPNVLLIMTDDCGFGSPSTPGQHKEYPCQGSSNRRQIA